MHPGQFFAPAASSSGTRDLLHEPIIPDSVTVPGPKPIVSAALRSRAQEHISHRSTPSERGPQPFHLLNPKIVKGRNGKTRIRNVPRLRKNSQLQQQISDPLSRTLRTDLEALNTRLIEEAFKNKVVVDINVTKDLFDENSHWKGRNMGKVADLGFWDDSKPRMVVSTDGIVLLAVFPHYLAEHCHNQLFQAMMEFGQDVNVNIRREAADENSRDNPASYERLDFDDEIHGVFQLVLLWKAIGHTDLLAGPSKDMVKNCSSFTKASELLAKLRTISERIDDMYKKLDPAQHDFLVDFRARLQKKYAHYRAFGKLDPTFFIGRSCIYNRATPEHFDSRDPKGSLTPLLTMGKYLWGRLHLPQFGLDVDYGPATMVFVRGGCIKHGVSYKGGQRICIAHFLHAYMLKDVGLPEPPLSPYTCLPV